MTIESDLRIISQQTNPDQWTAWAYPGRDSLVPSDIRGMGATQRQAEAHLFEQIATRLRTGNGS